MKKAKRIDSKKLDKLMNGVIAVTLVGYFKIASTMNLTKVTVIANQDLLDGLSEIQGRQFGVISSTTDRYELHNGLCYLYIWSSQKSAMYEVNGTIYIANVYGGYVNIFRLHTPVSSLSIEEIDSSIKSFIYDLKLLNNKVNITVGAMEVAENGSIAAIPVIEDIRKKISQLTKILTSNANDNENR